MIENVEGLHVKGKLICHVMDERTAREVREGEGEHGRHFLTR